MLMSAASITQEGTLAGEIRSEAVLSGEMVYTIHDPDYSGPYTIRPDVEQQVLDTADKRMIDDVTIQAIPYYSVSNPQGGSTIIIGGE